MAISPVLGGLLSRIPASRVHTALADAWQAEGRLRRPRGGDAAAFRGVRVMASGLPDRQWNSGDVTQPDFDLGAVRAWYADRRQDFGLRVPAGMRWKQSGTLFNRQRCMGLGPEAFRPAPMPHGVTVHRAGPAELDAFSYVDAAAFGDPLDRNRAWCEPQLAFGDEHFVPAIAYLGHDPVGVAMAVRTGGEEWAHGGACVSVFGVAVLQQARRRGIGAALTSALVHSAFAEGAGLAVLNPDTPVASRLYAGLGFVETGGLDIYVDF